MELTPGTVRLPVDLTADSMATLSNDLHAAVASSAPIVTLIGATDDTFCIGLAVGADRGGEVRTQAFAELLVTMHEAPKPLLAVVDGRAIGGGMGLACACDWVVASERASFALPELLWGLVPAIIWPVITDRVAPHVARQWTLSAYSRSAEEAFAAGVVDELRSAGQLEQGIARAHRTLKRLEPGALRCLRRWSRESRVHALPQALRRGAEITAAMVSQPAVQDRWRAFAEGGSPWSD
jgi:enoyl-CoA hydratase/carnithine racemase